MTDILTDAHAVLLPAIDGLALTEGLRAFLRGGGRSLLLGESRAEYLARGMSAERIATETAANFRVLVAEVAALAGPALIALDQEPAGIARLHRLVPALPGAGALAGMEAQAIEAAAHATALAARDLGVRMFLSPVVDCVTGRNPWLAGRVLSSDPAQVARIAAAFVRGVERAGVIAVTKHFPGHHDITGDPAVEICHVTGTRADLEPGFAPFHAVIAAGAGGVMTGPALVPALDPVLPSSLSGETVALLRGAFGFNGLAVSDDLDAAATLRGRREVAQAAVEALAAGCDLLLLSAANDLAEVTGTIAEAVAKGRLPRDRLAEAAGRVRAAAG